MKHTKKLAALLLALTLVLSLSVAAFAATDCSITIQGAVKGETYNAYKIFDVTADGEAYSYTITNEQTTTGSKTTNSNSWFKTIQDFKVNNSAVFTLTPSAGDATKWVVSVNSGFGGGTGETSYVKELAKALNDAYLAMESKPTVSGTGTGTDSGGTVSATINSLEPGYYFVDSSLGALCALDTVNGPNQVIYEKNSEPSITKEVWNPSSSAVTSTIDTSKTDEGSWTKSTSYATVDVSNNVYYKLTVKTGSNTSHTDIGTQTGVDADYVIEDVLPTGFSVVTTEGATASTVAITTPGSEGTTESWIENTDYTKAVDGQKLTITLLKSGKLATLAQNTDITITYQAKMTPDTVGIGVNGQTKADGTTSAKNENMATLTYQTKDGTGVVRGAPGTAIVYTYTIGGTTKDKDGNEVPIIQKIDGTTGANNKPLQGVKFVLSKTVGDTTYYATVKAAVQNAGVDVDGTYYLTGWTNDASANGKLITSKVVTTTDDSGTTYTGGTIEVRGLDAGDYTITEVEALPGYNLMKGTITVKIDETGTVSYTYNGDATNPEATTTHNTITIKNYSGTELPTTGGMGTTLFYILGGVLALGAAVLLVTRRRMRADK